MSRCKKAAVQLWKGAYLREGSIVPQIALVWEAVANVAELAFLDVLLDGIEHLLFGDLCPC